VFYYEASLEIMVSILSTLPHLMHPQTGFELWSAGIAWYFVATETFFLIFFVVFLFFPWPSP